MGTNSKSSDDAYAVTPTLAPPPAEPQWQFVDPTPTTVFEALPATQPPPDEPLPATQPPPDEPLPATQPPPDEPLKAATPAADTPDAPAAPVGPNATNPLEATEDPSSIDDPQPSALADADAAAVVPAAVPAPDPALSPAEQTGIAAAAHVDPILAEDDETAPPLTPVPEVPPAGAPTGAPILVGGEDLLNSQATLVAYLSPDGPREVLLTHVAEEAEEKLLDALTISGTQMVDVEVEEQVKEQLQLDKENDLALLVTKATTSVQHKLQSNAPISEQSIVKHQKALDAVSAVLANPNLTDEERAMAQHYMDQLNVVKDKIDNGGSPMPYFTPYEGTVTKTVTKQIPAPSADPEPGTLAAELRNASRINAALDLDSGEVSWDGEQRSPASGKEYAIELGDGWSAVYRPYAVNASESSEFSMRGQLEVHAPVGPGHGKELVDRLAQLHLVNAPMTAAEGEWTYLSNNVHAQELHTEAGIQDAFSLAQGLEEQHLHELVSQRTDALMGLDADQLQARIKRLQLEAAKTALPKKVDVLREAVAKAAGYANGQALAASSGYQPAPDVSGKWLTWTRFDVAGDTEKYRAAFTDKVLKHSIGSGNLATLFATTGVLASTEKRAVMGIGPGVGISESEDKNSGGANSVFLRVADETSIAYESAGTLVWDDPSVLMRRSDYYAHSSDCFGAINPKSHKYAQPTRDPLKIATFDYSSNEVMFRDGIDLLGAEAPSRIICYPEDGTKLLNLFASRGITHLGGRSVEDIVEITDW